VTFALALLSMLSPQQPAACPLGPRWGTEPATSNRSVANGVVGNRLSMVDGPLTWNGSPVTDKLVARYLGQVARLSPPPGLTIDTTGMPCAERRRLAAMADAGGKLHPGPVPRLPRRSRTGSACAAPVPVTPDLIRGSAFFF
jgi:hypothetical protein